MTDCITSIRLFLLSIAVCSVAYPAATLGFASLVAPEARQGSLVRDGKGAVVGSRLLAQHFTRPRYFWPRPSAVDYDASATGGSNLSPTNTKLAEQARKIINQLKPREGQRVPADLVTASGSGMDPHISLSAAMFQAPRVASERNLDLDRIKELVNQHTDSPTLAAFGGEPVVNVLELNLALDSLQE
jgi:K+-transporting ATPase ATPase C chain